MLQDGFLACGDSTCIERGFFCNGDKECPDGSDENVCGECVTYFELIRILFGLKTIYAYLNIITIKFFE